MGWPVTKSGVTSGREQQTHGPAHGLALVCAVTDAVSRSTAPSRLRSRTGASPTRARGQPATIPLAIAERMLSVVSHITALDVAHIDPATVTRAIQRR